MSISGRTWLGRCEFADSCSSPVQPAMGANSMQPHCLSIWLAITQAFGGFINRLSTVIFENALVIQGNRCSLVHTFASMWIR